MGKARPALSPFSLISLREQSSSFSLQRASQRIGRRNESGHVMRPGEEFPAALFCRLADSVVETVSNFCTKRALAGQGRLAR